MLFNNYRTAKDSPARATMAFLEYEWISGLKLLTGEEVESGINLIRPSGNVFEKSEFAFWLLRTRGKTIPLDEMYEGYSLTLTEIGPESC